MTNPDAPDPPTAADTPLSLPARMRDHVDAAIAALGREPLDDVSVHTARKALKRARALLRLLRPAIGPDAFRHENRVLRDAARSVSGVRDAKVLGDTWESLMRRMPPQADRAAWSDDWTGDRHRDRPDVDAVRKATSSLLDARTRMTGLAEPAAADVRKGLRRVYAAGRRRMRAAQKCRTDEALHEWRKQVKYLWHALQALQPENPAVIGELATQTHRLADHLGDDHDLALLRNVLAPPATKHPGDAALLALLEQRRGHLQWKAFRDGRLIYADKPKTFARGLLNRSVRRPTG